MSEVAADLAVSVQVHDTADADDGVQWNQIIQRNSEQLAVKEPSRRLVKRLMWTQVVVSERQALSTANKLHASLHDNWCLKPAPSSGKSSDFADNTVTVTINGLVKLSAFNAHICPSKYLVSFSKVEMVAVDTTSSGNLFQ